MTTPLQKAAQALMDALVQTDFTCRLGEQLDACEKALDAEIAQSVEPVAWHPTEAAITALKRFEETCTDNEGYDVPKDTMRNLQAIGLIYRTYGDMYCITDFGRHILASPPANAEQAQPVEPVSKPSLYIHKLGLAFLRAAHDLVIERARKTIIEQERDALKDAARMALAVLNVYDAEEIKVGREAIAALEAVL